MSVTITILYDNRLDNCSLQEGMGFSALIEFEGKKMLFDTGGDYHAFSSNLEALGIPYREITHLLFSHRHWDHIAGIKAIAQKVSEGVPLYVPKSFPKKFLPLNLSKHIVNSFEEIAPNIYSLVLRGGFWLYEQTLIVKTPQGIGIITGCAHAGIDHIVQIASQHVPGDIFFVLGGFHLRRALASRRRKIIQKFQELGVQNVAPCHCSGDTFIRECEETYSSHFFRVGTGTRLIF